MVNNHKLIKFFEDHKYAECLKSEDAEIVREITYNMVFSKKYSDDIEENKLSQCNYYKTYS